MLDGFLKKLLGRQSDSKDVAKKRLKFALIYDKLEVSDNILENLHRDIVEVISRYFEIDRDAFKLDIRRSDELSALVVNTPILGAKHRETAEEKAEIEED
ncbi:MAG: cell division topological specificity factor MinE [Desulfococcaceae bacterium]